MELDFVGVLPILHKYQKSLQDLKFNLSGGSSTHMHGTR